MASSAARGAASSVDMQLGVHGRRSGLRSRSRPTTLTTGSPSPGSSSGWTLTVACYCLRLVRSIRLAAAIPYTRTSGTHALPLRGAARNPDRPFPSALGRSPHRGSLPVSGPARGAARGGRPTALQAGRRGPCQPQRTPGPPPLQGERGPWCFRTDADHGSVVVCGIEDIGARLTFHDARTPAPVDPAGVRCVIWVGLSHARLWSRRVPPRCSKCCSDEHWRLLWSRSTVSVRARLRGEG